MVPGTGSSLSFGSASPPLDRALGDTLGGDTGVGPAFRSPDIAGVADLSVGLIEALAGIGFLPCWISVACCFTDCGTWGPAPPDPPAAAAAAGLPGGGAAGGLLMTLLMTVALWLLAKMMLLRGGATYTGART